jgi:hypothetical protein
MAIEMKTLWIGFLSLLALVFSTAVFANEFSSLPQVKEITRGQPKDVVALIERIAECNHWSDEEPYDKERAEWIRKALERARCGGLDSDEQALERKRKGNKKALEAIENAKRLVM